MNKKNENKSEKLQTKITEGKLKPLIPTLRTKKRFVKIQIESDKKYDFKELSDKLSYEIIYWMGAIDYGKAGIWLLKDKFDYKEQTLIIKTALEYKDKLIASLALTKKLNGNNINIKTLKISGTLKGLEK
jgi:RNase P/RNase MRP subunit POP5